MKIRQLTLSGSFSERATRHPWKTAGSLTIATVASLLFAATASPAQTVIDIYNFTGQNSSAAPSAVTPAQGRDGNLYGTTYGQGGTNYGTIFKTTTTGAFKQLYTFDSTTGSQPNAGLTLASDGNFYGTSFSGGSAGFGVLFRISASGTYAVLHDFAGGADGAAPASPPLEGGGDLYGTTYGNSTTSSTVYKFTRASGTFATIYQFDQSYGSGVIASLIQATDGNLYGTAYQGGANNCGSIFKLTTSGTLLWYYSFPCAPGGANPVGPLLQGADGNFYGTTSQGGNPGVGTVFKLDHSGAVSILYNFRGFLGGASDGSTPFGGLVQATDGKLYGSTIAGGTQNVGTLFQIGTGGAYKLLYNFTNKGSSPSAAPFQHTNGLLYGTTSQGGSLGFGVVYGLGMKLAPFVALVSYVGKAGGSVQILGQGFTGSTGVTFNGVSAASFSVLSDTYMTAVVPSGATTGFVAVTTPGGTLTSNKKFRIIGGTARAARAKSGEPISHATKNTN
jgi:uncharacterized repeat protein (TIGR03803 family)